MRRLTPWSLGAIGLFMAAQVAAIDYRSVVEATLLYDAPSQQATPVFAIARGTPVEAVVTLDAWVKVRDIKGELAWVEKRLLSDKRNLIVRVEPAQVRSRSEEAAPMVFEAANGVLLELLESGPSGWAKVRHRDGQQGYIKATQVWGL